MPNKGVFVENEYICLSAKNAPNKKIISINIDKLDFDNPKLIVGEKPEEIINDFKVTKDAIYFTTAKYGVEAHLYKVNNSIETKIETPKKAGRIQLYTKSITSNDLWVSTRGWTSSNIRYKFDSNSNRFTEDNISPKIYYPEFKNIITEEILVKSHDGTEVPLSIVYNKNIKMNGTNPTFFYGYGAYGDSNNPFFSPVFLTWIQNGGVLCLTHVRGGGEKGDAWHKGGYKTTKPNTWKDLIASVEYMINKKFTSSKHTAIYGSSAGGIMVGRAMTEHPDLFAAVISESGMMNTLRRESSSGGSNYKEYGTIKDSTECMALIKMDSYLHLQKGEKYPATMLTAGMNDPRVKPWMSGKFTAKLQAYNTSNNPIIYKVDYNSGHDGDSDPDSVYKEWANVFVFALWQTGHPDYQLK